jgi:hypothetical protein
MDGRILEGNKVGFMDGAIAERKTFRKETLKSDAKHTYLGCLVTGLTTEVSCRIERTTDRL